MHRVFHRIGLFLAILLMSSCSSDNNLLMSEEQFFESVQEGVYEEENRWVYRQMNHYYLWREDMPDSLSCDYAVDPVTFYKALLSPKDRFSYSIRNTNYNGELEFVDYGFAYQKYRTLTNDEFLQVLYVTSDVLKKKGLKRGDWVKLLDSDEFALGIMNNNNFVPTDTLDLNLGTTKMDNKSTVYLDSIYHINKKKIGYLCYLEFDDVMDLQKVFSSFYAEKIDELILDLRYNPGGYVSTCRYLCNSIVSEVGYGQIFQQYSYNDRLSEVYHKTTGCSKVIENFEFPTSDDEYVIGPRLYGLNLNRIYVLTSENTASASEAAIICLRPYMDVVLIGEQTYGKGVGSITISDNKYKYMLQPIVMRYYNANMESTPDDGIPVDVEVSGGYHTIKKELGDVSEPLLSAALKCIVEDGDILTDVCAKSDLNKDLLFPIGSPTFFKIKNDF